MNNGRPVSQHRGAQLVGLLWLVPIDGLVIAVVLIADTGGDEDLVVGGLDDEECVRDVCKDRKLNTSTLVCC